MANDRSKTFSIFDHILNNLHRYFCILVRCIMVMMYGKRGQSIQPINDRILLESATSIAEKIRTKQVTSTQVMGAFIRRTKQINPLLNCVIDERFKDALREATEVDKLIASNTYTIDQLKELKPFLGVPMSIKDSIGVKGMIQSCGIWPRRGLRSLNDADTIQAMRNAGAIPFVITNVPELCLWWESANVLYGRTCNPYDTNRTVGGSSGGEGALLAAGGSPFGIGSDLAGSIRMPALFNGIFGHKPSALMIPNAGQWPEITDKNELYATVIGPMCRYACDLQPMMKVLVGNKANKFGFNQPVDLTTLKYFYQENDGGAFCVSSVDDDIRLGLNKVIQHLTNELNVMPQRVEFDEFKESMSIWMVNVKSETPSHGLEYELTNYNGHINTYIELLKWCIGKSKYTLPALLNCLHEKLFAIQCGSTEQLLKSKLCKNLQRQFDEMLDSTGVFIYPTHPTVAPYHREPIIKPFNMSYTAIFNVLGLPSTAIPLGLGKDGLPIGVQVVANHNQDRLCLAVACELERAFGGWVAPEFIN